MAPKRSRPTRPSPSIPSSPPAPFKALPSSLEPFTTSLSKRHIYVTHIDTKPRSFKRKIFLVPVAMNLAVVLLFVWRVNYILPWYGALFLSTLGYTRDAAVLASSSSTSSLAAIVLRRAFTFLLDFLLIVFVWPWPVEFCFGMAHSNPVTWRWKTGFRDREIYVRRSREWDAGVLDGAMAPGDGAEKRALILSKVKPATDPLLLREKTGYLLMNGDWDLDWAGMIAATALVDENAVAPEAFERVVMLYSKEFGWVCLDRGSGEGKGPSKEEDERRRQVLAFRDALAAVSKEDMFYRWIEIVQFEASQPGGFGPEKQVEVAGRIREMFAEEGINFDEFWREAVGSDTAEGLAGMM
ncbi:KRR1 small subunit processome component protein [Coniochaeta hoffmannii]|uniref:KRR1 small subunit processome component protein n=1 Tax=Coniochaeta hoffmannii TaxID=91930 RepID=A0AA38SDN2_9PEZI|nr:KRR1 small subunit processome component protein [Coniochaeta hoffmannii]